MFRVIRSKPGKHSEKFGVDLIHEPVLSGALSGTQERAGWSSMP